MIIRNETPADHEEISQITIAAFKTLPISNHTEQFIINALRTADALTVSLVAKIGSQIVGHIAFSPVTISDGTVGWYVLGPISVLPEYHKQGVGKSLVNSGLAILRELNGLGCTLVGDPNYYNRFGFRNYPELIYEGIPQEYFLVLPFTDQLPQGIVFFHEAFMAKS
jgi:putative acetyltransferase